MLYSERYLQRRVSDEDFIPLSTYCFLKGMPLCSGSIYLSQGNT